MPNLELRIGTKLAIAAGLGVVLVAGMVVNEQLSSAAVELSNEGREPQGVERMGRCRSPDAGAIRYFTAPCRRP